MSLTCREEEKVAFTEMNNVALLKVLSKHTALDFIKARQIL